MAGFLNPVSFSFFLFGGDIMKTFDMDGSEHIIGDKDCCHRFGGVHKEDMGVIHFQAVYGGQYYECDKCHKTGLSVWEINDYDDRYEFYMGED